MKKKAQVSFLILMLLGFQSGLSAQKDQVYKEMEVGVILDMGSWLGKSVYSCITMALSDFYTINPHYRTRIVLQTRDTNGEPLSALSAALDLLENTKVQAIIGPESTVEAKLLEVLGEKANIPILSFSTSPFSNQNPYLLRVPQDETTQFVGIAAMVESLKWKNVIVICEDTANGREMATIVNAFQEKGIHVTYTSVVSTSASNEQALEELHKILAMQITTFVMHTSPSLASNLFAKAKNLGIMGEGYIWIVTSKTTNFLDFMDAEAVESMQGVVGFKSYIPASRELSNFILKWRKESDAVNPFMQFKEPGFNGIWAYDALFALAMAVERVIPQAEKEVTKFASKDMASINSSQRGATLLNQTLRIKFHGLGGEIKFMNARTIPNALEIINVIGKGERRVGFWTATGEFTKEIGKKNSSSNSGLQTIIWPGGTITVPKHRRLQMSGKKLRMLVPAKDAFKNLVQLNIDPRTNLSTFSGLSGDVFNTAFNALDYEVGIEFIPFYLNGETYNDLIDKVYREEYDGLIGDVTITANRSLYVDFTLPFTDQGIGTLARNGKKSMWIFLDPLSRDLWITSACFFLVFGFVIWFIEHRTNEEFQGPAGQQIGTTLWFAFSTLVYAHREKLQSNLSRFVVIIWVFVVLVLTSSYTATLSSLLTVQQIASTDISIGFQSHSYSPLGDIINNLRSVNGKYVQLYTPEDYAKVLRRGNVGAITDELPYIKTILAMYSTDDFSLIATSSTNNGFGFAFQKGSPLAMKMSTQIAKLREDGTLKALEDKWLKRQSALTISSSPKILNLYGLRGLFVMSGVSMALALLVSIVYLVREKWHVKYKMYILSCMLRMSTQVHVQDDVRATELSH